MNICFFIKALMGVEITRMKAQDVKFVVSAKFTKGTYRRLMVIFPIATYTNPNF